MSRIKEKSLYYFSDKRSIYVGSLSPLYTRVNVCPTLILSLENNIKLIDPQLNETLVGKSFLIPAGARVVLDSNYSHIAMCVLDEFGIDMSTLIPQMNSMHTLNSGNHLYSGIKYESELIRSAENIWTTRASAEYALEDFDSWVRFFARGTRDNYVPDKRVIDAVSYMNKNCTKNISVDCIASSVHISASRLTQLFRKVIGSPVRRFRLWQRIEYVVVQIHKGVSLSDAAISAGFSDYSQFSRIFKELYGVRPGAAKNTVEIRAA